MTRQTIGMCFLFIAAFIWVGRYIAAAIYGAGSTTQSTLLFQGLLDYVGNAPTVLSILSAFIGISYLIWGEYETSKKTR